MRKIKYIIPAFAAALSCICSFPIYADEQNETEIVDSEQTSRKQNKVTEETTERITESNSEGKIVAVRVDIKINADKRLTLADDDGFRIILTNKDTGYDAEAVLTKSDIESGKKSIELDDGLYSVKSVIYLGSGETEIPFAIPNTIYIFADSENLIECGVGTNQASFVIEKHPKAVTNVDETETSTELPKGSSLLPPVDDEGNPMTETDQSAKQETVLETIQKSTETISRSETGESNISETESQEISKKGRNNKHFLLKSLLYTIIPIAIIGCIGGIIIFILHIKGRV